MSKPAAQFEPLAVAVLTVSDTRTPETDTSGDLLVQRLLELLGSLLSARAVSYTHLPLPPICSV